MSVTLGATCPYCGPVDLTPADITLMVETDPGRGYVFEGFYSFFCTPCGLAFSFEAPPLVVELLVTAGVRVTAMPAELAEPHTGPVISHDDLLDLHLALADWVSA